MIIWRQQALSTSQATISFFVSKLKLGKLSSFLLPHTIVVMMKTTIPSSVHIHVAIMLFSLLSGMSSAQLSANFYSKSCPSALSIIKSGVISAIKAETRMGASLLRLHFHDCFVNASFSSIILFSICSTI